MAKVKIPKRCNLCKVEFNEKSVYEKYKARYYHTECVELKKLREIEKVQWDILYEYVKLDILGYPESMNLPHYIINRLHALRDGKFITRKVEYSSVYTYDIILMTFKASKIAILSALNTKEFKNENNKFNYIMAIIENNINDVALRVKNKEKHDSETQNIEVQEIEDESVSYVVKGKNKNLDKFKDLW